MNDLISHSEDVFKARKGESDFVREVLWDLLKSIAGAMHLDRCGVGTLTAVIDIASMAVDIISEDRKENEGGKANVAVDVKTVMNDSECSGHFAKKVIRMITAMYADESIGVVLKEDVSEAVKTMILQAAKLIRERDGKDS